MKDFCIGISCVEDLTTGVDYFTSLTLKHLNNLKKHGNVFVQTNNESVFKDKGVSIIPFTGKLLTLEEGLNLKKTEKENLNLQEVYSTHDKLDIIDYVFKKGYSGCLILDADEELTEQSNSIITSFKQKLNNLEPGLHFLGYWGDFYKDQKEENFEWQFLKQHEYFNNLRNSLKFELDNKTRPVRESNFFVKYFDDWNLFYNNTKKYRDIAIKNDLTLFPWKDNKTYRPLGTGEGLSWIISINELNLQEYTFINKTMKDLDLSLIRHYHPLFSQ